MPFDFIVARCYIRTMLMSSTGCLRRRCSIC